MMPIDPYILKACRLERDGSTKVVLLDVDVADLQGLKDLAAAFPKDLFDTILVSEPLERPPLEPYSEDDLKIILDSLKHIPEDIKPPPNVARVRKLRLRDERAKWRRR